ncbi:MAG: response regulator [Bacillota bacterium]
MYKLLIVDDEKIVIEGLKYATNWKDYEIEIVGSASNGKEALQKIIDAKPDIVLQDIRIPEINGLDLIKEVKRLELDTVFIIISGYSEFTYAKRAIELEALDYLVKPIEVDEIIGSVEKAICKLKKQNEEKLIDKRLKLYEDALEEKQFLEFMLGNRNVQPEMINDIKQFSCAVLEIRDSKLNEHNVEEKMNSVSLAIKNKLTERGIKCFPYTIDQSLTILVSLSQFYRMTDFLDDLFHIIPDDMKSNVSVGISHTYTNLLNVNQSYKEAKDSVRIGIYSNQRITYYSELETMNTTIGSRIITIIDQYFTSSHSDDLFEMDHLIDHIIDYSKQSRLPPQKSTYLCYKLVNNLLEYVDNEFELNPIMDDRYEVYEQLNSLNSLDEISNWLRGFAQNIKDQIEDHKVSYNDKLILDIKNHLNTNYRETIVLEDLGKHFYKNPSYLCSLFSKSVGKTIFEYITLTRINNAKKLLRTSNCKVADIATQVGYENQKYFYQVFKKNVGITPSQYRSKHLVK